MIKILKKCFYQKNIEKKSLSLRFITRYNISNDYNFKTTLYNVIDDNVYNNFIDLYEVGGFMIIFNFINFSNEFNKLNNYNKIIKIIDVTLKNNIF